MSMMIRCAVALALTAITANGALAIGVADSGPARPEAATALPERGDVLVADIIRVCNSADDVKEFFSKASMEEAESYFLRKSGVDKTCSHVQGYLLITGYAGSLKAADGIRRCILKMALWTKSNSKLEVFTGWPISTLKSTVECESGQEE